MNKSADRFGNKSIKQEFVFAKRPDCWMVDGSLDEAHYQNLPLLI
jgi:hypothetical protein